MPTRIKQQWTAADGKLDALKSALESFQEKSREMVGCLHASLEIDEGAHAVTTEETWGNGAQYDYRLQQFQATFDYKESVAPLLAGEPSVLGRDEV